MAIKVSGTQVVSSSRQLTNITGIDATTKATLESGLTNIDANTLDGLNYTAFASSSQGALADSALQPSDIGSSVQAYSAVLDGTTASFTTADETKLDGIETGATADQTGAEIKSLYEAESDTNAYTDAEKTKLAGIETSADVTDTANVTAAGALMTTGGTMTGNLILNADPTASLQAATKSYVDTIAAAGVHYHSPVRVEAPSNLTATYNNGTSGVGATLTNSGTQAALTIDGITLSTSDRVLVYNQTNPAHNGIYTVTNTGSGSTNWVLTRATDADSYGVSDPDALGQGDAFFVKEGDTGAGELYIMNTEGTITFGTTGITFEQIAATAVYSAGTGLTLDGTQFNIDGTVLVDSDIGSTVQAYSSVLANTTASYTTAEESKLAGIEAGATGDQTAAEIRALVEAATDSNVFTDADHSKLNGIEAGATGDQTAAEIRALVEAATDSNVFTDADHSKLNGIEAGADVTDTANVTAAGALMDSEVTNLAAVKAFDPTDYATAAQGTLADSAVQPNDSPTFGSITVTGTVDGRDVAADGSKLDGIEAGADVTDAANVEPLVDTHLNTSTASSGEALLWNGSDYEWGAGGATSLDGLSDARVAGFSIGIGVSALDNDDGTFNSNTAVGAEAMKFTTNGASNSAFGYQALTANTTGGLNTAVGYRALYKNTTGGSNTAVGYNTLDENTTGTGNTALGRQALAFNTEGQDNTAVGRLALYNNETGTENVAVGYQALRNSTVGENTAVGYDAGSTVTTGRNITVLGHNAEPSSGTVEHEITLGNTSVDKFRIPGLQASASNGDVLTYNSSTDRIELQAPQGATTGKAIAMAIVFGG